MPLCFFQSTGRKIATRNEVQRKPTGSGNDVVAFQELMGVLYETPVVVKRRKQQESETFVGIPQNGQTRFMDAQVRDVHLYNLIVSDRFPGSKLVEHCRGR